MSILDEAGCVFLRRGTIEDYYDTQRSTDSAGKPEGAAAEMEHVAQLDPSDVRERFSDVIRAIDVAAPLKNIDENALLREQLGSLLGSAMQIVRPEMADAELNVRASANLASPTPIFWLTNHTQQAPNGLSRSVEVRITSPLFDRKGFPFEIRDKDNLTATIEEKLPSK